MQGHLPLDIVARRPSQPGCEHLQGWDPQLPWSSVSAVSWFCLWRCRAFQFSLPSSIPGISLQFVALLSSSWAFWGTDSASRMFTTSLSLPPATLQRGGVCQLQSCSRTFRTRWKNYSIRSAPGQTLFQARVFVPNDLNPRQLHQILSKAGVFRAGFICSVLGTFLQTCDSFQGCVLLSLWILEEAKWRAESSACNGVTVAYSFFRNLNYRSLSTTSPDINPQVFVSSVCACPQTHLPRALGRRTPGAPATAGHEASNLWPQPPATGQDNGPSHGFCPSAQETQVATPTESGWFVTISLPCGL